MTDASLSSPASSPLAASSAQPTAVSLSAVDIPFGRMVLFFFKAGLAAIPATILLGLGLGLVGALLRGVFRVGYWGMHGGGFY
ncbi:MAG: hypothetical protein HEQ16_15460 [Bosea sp.]|jgi:hypothetical protein|nr:hypothetical protein [Bosea sp. (in: a-proteobacteria)]